jgi:hypothetical protein
MKRHRHAGRQPAVFGPVTSDTTCWWVPDAIGGSELAEVEAARAAFGSQTVGLAGALGDCPSHRQIVVRAEMLERHCQRTVGHHLLPNPGGFS